MLTAKQRQFLRGKAQKLTPILQVGKNGITNAVLHQLQLQINSQELVKISILPNSIVQSAELIQQVQKFDSQIQYVQEIGRMLILYKQAPQFSHRHLSLKVKQISR